MPALTTRRTLSTPPDRTRGLAQRAWLVVVLAVTSGATDAIGYLALGSAFTSVMTGNMVLLGVGAAEGDVALLLSCTVAIASYIVGAMVGTRIAGSPHPDDPLWPTPITAALWLELALFSVFAVAWWSLPPSARADWLLPLLGLNAAALGVQSSAIHRFGVSGLSTTYMTGTLTRTVIKLTAGQPLRDVGHSLTILLGLVGGAALGTLSVTLLPVAVPIVQVSTVLVVLARVHTTHHLRADR